MATAPDGRKGGWFGRNQELLRYSTLGIEMGVALVIGLLMGRWLDRFFGTDPWLTVVFSLFGIAAGFSNVFRLIARGTKGNGDDDPAP